MYNGRTDRSLDNEAIANQLEALLTPAITAQQAYYRQLGLRDRILNLPLMVAAVLTLLWREVPGVQELNRLLAREGFLWCEPTKVSQQALSQRFLTFPAELFERIFKQLLPYLKTEWLQRNSRPLPESVNLALKSLKANLGGRWLYLGSFISETEKLRRCGERTVSGENLYGD